jgi:hypothetical protein
VQRNVFGSVREEIAGDWRKLYVEEHHDLYCSPNVIRIIISRRMNWVRHGMHGMEGICIRDVGYKAWSKETTNYPSI